MPGEDPEDRQQRQQSEHPSLKQHKRHGSASGSSSGSRRPPLHRNNACLACRRKKRKCDGIHPVCTPCMNSANLYQEEPQCEWGGSAKHEDGGTKHEEGSRVKHEEDPSGTTTSSSSLPPLPSSASLNPNIASDPSLYYTTYDPSYGSFPSSSNGQAYEASASSDQNFPTSSSTTSGGTGTTTNTITSAGGKRKNLKRDNNSSEVEALQARVAELEAKLQAASVASSIQQNSSSAVHPSTGGSHHHPILSDGSSHPAAHVRFQLQDTLRQHLQHQTTDETAPTSSNASSTEMSAGGSRPNYTGTATGHNSSRQTTSSVSPFSSNGLPTPPTSANAGSAPFLNSPASNGSLGGHQDVSQSDTGNLQDTTQSYNTAYFTKPPSAQTQDAKWNMSGLPGYLNMTPPTSQPQSPYGPGNLLWTQWPVDLPQIEIVKALAGTALAMISDTLFLLPADAVFRSLALPPTDPRFPSTALLHALCALGATAFPLPPEARGYWQDAPSASKYHFRQSKKHLQTFNASQVLDDLRAAILLVIYSFAAEQFIDVWQLVGMSCRGLPATGLNHVQNHSALPSTRMGTTPGHFLRKPTYLPPPSDDYEVFYRSTTMWMAFSSDVWMGACSGWAMAIDLQDITTLLPVWPSDTTPLDVVLNQPSLDPHSQIFFTSHLDSPMISLHLSIKAMVLMRRVVDFLQRSTAPDSVINQEAKKLVRSSPAFVSLTETIYGFQQNFPEKARYHLQVLPSGKVDSNLLNAHIIPCTAILLLYEPFIYGSEDDAFYNHSMAAANRILQMTHSVYAHSKDTISMYYTQINYSWMVCNRTLIRAMRFKEDAGDQEGAKILRSSVEFLLARNSTLAAQSPLVCSCLGMIENLVKDETPWHRQ